MLHINLQSDSDQRHNDQTQYCTAIIMYYCKSLEAIFRPFTYFVPAGYTTDVEQVFILCF